MKPNDLHEFLVTLRKNSNSFHYRVLAENSNTAIKVILDLDLVEDIDSISADWVSPDELQKVYSQDEI